jgi:hypothetical protein
VLASGKLLLSLLILLLTGLIKSLRAATMHSWSSAVGVGNPSYSGILNSMDNVNKE